MAPPIRVLIPGDSQQSEALGLALAYAQEIAKKADAPNVLLVTHTKDQLRHTGLAANLGENAAKALLAGRGVSLSSGAILRHGTLATLRYSSGNPVVIAYYADDKLLDFVDGLAGVKGVVAVPWVPGEADQWRERWTPIVHGEEKQAPAAILDDPVVETALRSVSGIINLSHSLLQSRDREWVDDVLRILRAKGHSLDAAKIRNWAIRNGWKPGAADDLAKLVRKIAGMKTRPRLAAIPNAADRYARWKGGKE
ncbi:MAG: hypothetical protein KF780_12480 [Sphingomonas sp.]|nr:hypothetical protein [Sphingomonas sp.]